jgi:hypothetical protein
MSQGRLPNLLPSSPKLQDWLQSHLVFLHLCLSVFVLLLIDLGVFGVEIKPKASHLLDKHSTTELNPQLLYCRLILISLMLLHQHSDNV